jgi:hypothetical protein
MRFLLDDWIDNHKSPGIIQKPCCPEAPHKRIKPALIDVWRKLQKQTNEDKQMRTRLKMQIEQVIPTTHTDGEVTSEQLTMRCVFGDKDKGGVNAEWAKWTPSGDLRFNVSNPNVIGQFKAGEYVLIDVEHCDADD